MSTYSFISKLRKGAGFSTCSVLPMLSIISGMLIALQLLLSSVAYASSANSGYTFGNNQPLDQASVSVVRLVAAYTAPTIPPAPGCTTTATGLGVLVGSWPTTAGSTDFTNWVMTDGTLVDPNGISCGAGKPTEALTSLQIYVNDAYTNATGNPTSSLVKTLTCVAGACKDGTVSVPITCQVSAPCSGGVVLVPFHSSAPQPFVDMATADQTTPAPFGIGLASSISGTITPTPAQATQLLAPVQVTNTGDSKNELGMPIVNDVGQLLDMNTKAVDTGGTIRGYVTSQLSPEQTGHTNSLRDSWNQGIIDYYKPDYVNAQTDFKNAGMHNTLFRAGVAFWTLAMTKGGIAEGTPTTGRTPEALRTPVPNAKSVNLFGYFISDSLFTVLVVVALVLLIILAPITFTVVRRQMRQRKEVKEFAELNRRAEADAAQIAQREKEESLHAHQGWNSPQGLNPVNAAPPVQIQAAPVLNLRCPNCGTSVNRADKFCNNCHSPIPLSDSGWYVRLNKPPISASVPVTHTNPVVNVAQETSIPPRADPLCPRCQQPIPANAVFCASCGFSLSPAVALQTQGMAMQASSESSFFPLSLDAAQPLRELVREQIQGDGQDRRHQEEKVSGRLGQRLGNYQIISLLGEGGFAEVYLGEHIHLGSQAAIKVLHSQLARDERERFLAEARTLVRLVHPHIVRVLDFGIEEKTPFLVMDVAIDGTLRQRHPKGTRLSHSTVNSYVQQVADALQFAHDQRIIHRDIKPENMLIGR
jgi:Protein kinase domain/Double zinc ribbon